MTEEIIRIFIEFIINWVTNGFLEKVYENAMMIELKKDGFSAVSQNVRHLIL
ncbi:MAG: GxxExxY protein [Halobacteriota archaeon]